MFVTSMGKWRTINNELVPSMNNCEQQTTNLVYFTSNNFLLFAVGNQSSL